MYQFLYRSNWKEHISKCFDRHVQGRDDNQLLQCAPPHASPQCTGAFDSPLRLLFHLQDVHCYEFIHTKKGFKISRDNDGIIPPSRVKRQRFDPKRERVVGDVAPVKVEQEPPVPVDGAPCGPASETATKGRPIEMTPRALPLAVEGQYSPSSACLPTPCPQPVDGTYQESTPLCELAGGAGNNGANSQDSSQYHLSGHRHDGTEPEEGMPHLEGGEEPDEEDDGNIGPQYRKRMRMTQSASNSLRQCESNSDGEAGLALPSREHRMAMMDRRRYDVDNEDVYSPSQDNDSEWEARLRRPKRRKLRAPPPPGRSAVRATGGTGRHASFKYAGSGPQQVLSPPSSQSRNDTATACHRVQGETDRERRPRMEKSRWYNHFPTGVD